jgi:hypothetical protein
MRRLASFVALLMCSAISAQTTQPASINDSASDLAQIRLLNRTIDRQKQEMAQLKLQVAAMRAQLKSLGITAAPATSPSTQVAAQSTPHRIIFVRVSDAPTVVEEIRRAVKELDASQYFSVVTPNNGKVLRFEPELVLATDRNKQKFLDYMKPSTYFFPVNWLDGVQVAAKWRPDVMWIVGTPSISNEDQSIPQIKKLVAGTSTRINTVELQDYAPETNHLLWRIASETGGVCIDKKGEPISEPALPIKPPAPPPSPEPKSILQVK